LGSAESGVRDATPRDVDEVIRRLFAAIRNAFADFPRS
jgi:hypothetical protein